MTALELDRKLIEHIDMDNFSAIFISSLLTSPGDAKPDNFII